MTHNMTTIQFLMARRTAVQRDTPLQLLLPTIWIKIRPAIRLHFMYETAVPIFQSQHCTANEAWYWSKCTHPMQWMTWYKTQAWLLSGRCGSVTVCERHSSKACSGRRKCAVSYCVNGHHSRQEKYQARNKQDKEKHFLIR